MPTETLTRNGERTVQPDPSAPVSEEELRQWARKHVGRVRRLKMNVAAYVFGLLVLTPVWALTEWQSNGGFERWSDNSQPGDWEPWILYVAFIWGIVVAIEALKVHFDRPTTEAEVDRTLERLRSGS